MDYVVNAPEYSFSDSLKGLIQLLLSGILLCFAPSFSASILDARGGAMVAGKITQVVAAGVMTMGLRNITQWALKAPARMLGIPIKQLRGKLFQQNSPYKGKRPMKAKSKKLGTSQKKRSQKSINNIVNQLPQTLDKKLENRAKTLIQSSYKKNIDLSKYSSKEKKAAIKMARENPMNNFIRRNIYFELLSELQNEGNEVNRRTAKKNPKKTVKKNLNKAIKKKLLSGQ